VDSYPAQLGEHQDAVVEGGSIADLFEREGMPAGAGAMAPREARESGLLSSLPTLKTAEERLLRLVEPRQYLLQEMRVDGGVLWRLGPHRLQLGFLLEPRKGDVAAAVGSAALLQGSRAVL
jgi:hypothetical protein